MSRPKINKCKVAKLVYNHYGTCSESTANLDEHLLAKQAISYIENKSRGIKRPNVDICPGTSGGGKKQRTNISSVPSSQNEFDQVDLALSPDRAPIGHWNDGHSNQAIISDMVDEPTPPNQADEFLPPIEQLQSQSLSPSVQPSDELPQESPLLSSAPSQSNKRRPRIKKTVLSFAKYNEMFNKCKLLDSSVSVFKKPALIKEIKCLFAEASENRVKLSQSAIDKLEQRANNFIAALVKDIYLRAQFEGKSSLLSTKRNLVLETLLLWKMNKSFYWKFISNYFN